MKKIFISIILILVSFVFFVLGSVKTEASNDSYFASCEGLTGDALLEELAKISLEGVTEKGYTPSYDALKTQLPKTDADVNDTSKMILFYSGAKVGASWGSVAWNREHVWPKSLAGNQYENNNAGADVHHIRPTYTQVNSSRSNKLFTDFEFIGQSGNEYTYNGYLSGYQNSSYWEPTDNVKGDTARILMYMIMHYDKDLKANQSYSLAIDIDITKVVYAGGGESKAWELLLKWNEEDPVDAWEARRNEECYKITGIYNPFISYPAFAEAIWGDGSAVTPEPTTPDYNNEVKELFTKYYDNGVYVKDTVINLTAAAKDDLINHFHANINILQRTTYYKGNELWMSRDDGKYSYYGTSQEGLTNATSETPNVTPSDAKVVVKNTTMLDYYTTLKTLINTNAEWNKEGNVYYTTDEKVLKYYLDFTAPCLLTSIFESDYFKYEKATLEEVDGTLVLKLVINSQMHGALTSNEYVLSQATIKVSEQSKIEKAKTELAKINNVSIASNYTLPTNIGGVAVSWSGDNVSGNIVTYTKPTTNFDNNLTATLTIGELTETVTIKLIQLKYEEKPAEMSKISIAQFLELADPNTYYVLTGEVTSIANTTYGNLNLKDSSGEIFVYGVLPEKDSTDKQNFSKLGISVGDTITISGKYLYYNNTTKEVSNAYLISKGSSGTTNPEPDEPVIPDTPAASEITLSFSSTVNRISLSSTQQVWAVTGVTLTNNKGASTSNVVDYSNPARFYASSEIIITATNMVKIEFTCGSSSYATALKNSIGSTATVSVNDSVVTVTFSSPVSSFTISKLTAQVRMNSMKVYTS